MQDALSKNRLKQSHKAILYHYPHHHHHHPEHKHYIIRFITLGVSQATLACREMHLFSIDSRDGWTAAVSARARSGRRHIARHTER